MKTRLVCFNGATAGADAGIVAGVAAGAPEDIAAGLGGRDVEDDEASSASESELPLESAPAVTAVESRSIYFAPLTSRMKPTSAAPSRISANTSAVFS